MSAIVLDGELKGALCAVRSLGQAGIVVHAGSVRGSAMALHSRHAADRFVYPSPLIDREEFVRAVLAQARACPDKPVVFAFADATYLTLFEYRATLEEDMVLVFPKEGSVAVAFDKEVSTALAVSHAIPTIRHYEPHEYAQITFPAVVKNRHSVVWHRNRGVAGSARFVFDQNELEACVTAVAESTGEAPLVQEFVSGDEYGVEMLCQDGQAYAVFAHHRVRSLSPTGGAAVVKETAADSVELETMKRHAITLAKVLHWDGPIMVEFKIDSEGQPRFMEINGRFWGSLPLAVRAGVDFPKLFYRYAQSGVAENISHRVQPARTRHFLGDVRHLGAVLFSRDRMRQVRYPSRLTALWLFIIESFKSCGDIFRITDPMPSIFEYIDILKR